MGVGGLELSSVFGLLSQGQEGISKISRTTHGDLKCRGCRIPKLLGKLARSCSLRSSCNSACAGSSSRSSTTNNTYTFSRIVPGATVLLT